MAARDYPLNAHSNELCDNHNRQIAVCVVPGEAAIVAARLNRLQVLLKSKRSGGITPKYRKYPKIAAKREYPLHAEGNQIFDLRGRQVMVCTIAGESGELVDKLNRYQALVKEIKAAKRYARPAAPAARATPAPSFGTRCQSSSTRW